MIPTHIVIKDISKSSSVKSRIENHLQRLALYSGDIKYSHVVVGANKRRSIKNILFNVHIDLMISGKKFVVSHIKNKDLYLAIHEAFNKIERQFKNYLSKTNKLNIYSNQSLKLQNLNTI